MVRGGHPNAPKNQHTPGMWLFSLFEGRAFHTAMIFHGSVKPLNTYQSEKTGATVLLAHPGRGEEKPAAYNRVRSDRVLVRNAGDAWGTYAFAHRHDLTDRRRSADPVPNLRESGFNNTAIDKVYLIQTTIPSGAVFTTANVA